MATILLLGLILWPRRWMPASEHSPHAPRHTDKVVHFGLFAACTVLWLRVRPGHRAWSAGVLVAGLVLAVGTEVAQGTTLIERDADPYDALADSLGAGAGVVLMSVVLRRDQLAGSSRNGRTEESSP